MVKHNNPTIAQDASRILNSTGEFLSDEVDGPVAVIPIVPRCNIVYNANGTTSGTGNTAGTLPSDKDFYLVSCVLGIVKDATCDVADGQINARVIVDGVAKNVIALPVLTLTAQNQTASISFPTPLKLDRGSVLSTTQSTFTAGKFYRNICFIGYFLETTR